MQAKTIRYYPWPGSVYEEGLALHYFRTVALQFWAALHQYCIFLMFDEDI